MAAEFKLPDLGENVESADVVDVLVSPGDRIEKDQSVIEAETEKAVMEIPSTVSGTIQEVKVSKGDTVKVGQVILTYEANGAAQPAAEEKPAEKPAAEEKPAEQEAAPPAEEKAEAKPQAAEAAQAEQKQEAAQQQQQQAGPVSEETQPTAPAAGQTPVPAAPSVRQFAREIGVDIHQVPGSGPGGRISVEDVKAYARSRTTGAAPAPGRAADQPRLQREAMTKVRKITAQAMASAWDQVPHVTIHDKADVTDLEALRQRFKKQAEQKGGRLTITAIFVKIAAAALQRFPNANASIDVEKQEIEYHNYYNVGVAVDTPRGLVVPVIRDADQKSILDLAVELTEISTKARDGKLMPDDMSGATFTITNLGSLGTGHFTPIVNPPQVAILGMGRAHREPVWDEPHGQFLPRLRAPLSLSFDHRLVDGADGARFLRWIVEAVENPMLMSLDR